MFSYIAAASSRQGFGGETPKPSSPDSVCVHVELFCVWWNHANLKRGVADEGRRKKEALIQLTACAFVLSPICSLQV